MKGLSPNQWTAREFARIFPSCLQVDFSETSKLSEIKKKGFPPNFYAGYCLELTFALSATWACSPQDLFFF